MPLIQVKLILKLVQSFFLRYRKIAAERDLYPLLRAVIGAAVCISVAIASIVLTPLLKHREYGLIDWADHLTLTNTKGFHRETNVFIRYVL